METSYPVFESGQVLSSIHLNDLVEYLEQQDRLTRSNLIGIGIVCGLEVNYQTAENRIRLSGGCAVTSSGHLIIQPEVHLDKYRSYTLPVSEVEELPEGIDWSPNYPFFVDASENQIPLWELLPTDHSPAPGEPSPTQISPAFLQNKVVLLYLEQNLESLKSCDINDCSDKGLEMEFVVRPLLIERDSTESILEMEAAIAERPIDRFNHPRLELEDLQIEKINPALYEINSIFELFGRIMDIADGLSNDISQALENGYDAYKYLLSDMYPIEHFPTGPFGNPGYFQQVFTEFDDNIFLIQYLYGFLHDMVRSHNEFLDSAFWLEVECCPHPGRFPRHMLLGLVTNEVIAFSATAHQPGGLASIDPLQANTGFGPDDRPAAFRHHFVPSPLFDRQHERIRKVRSLHYRTYLLAYRYSNSGLLQEDIRITPSVDGDFPMSEMAIPFYYKFAQGDDLHRNWSFDKTIGNGLKSVYSHQFMQAVGHPLKNRMDPCNFYRIEGTVGKGLGHSLRELTKLKRKLGLSFAIEPVYVGLTVEDDLSSIACNQEALLRARQSLTKLLMCRLQDLDIIFLILMAFIFYYLYAIIQALTSVGYVPMLTRSIARNDPRLSGDNLERPAARAGFIRQPTLRASELKPIESLLQEIRAEKYQVGSITSKLVGEKPVEESIGSLYTTIAMDIPSSALYDKTLEYARTYQPEADSAATAQAIYPSLSLLDKSEQLIQVASASTLADFDSQQFQVRYEAFVNAFEDYRLSTENLDLSEEPELAAKHEVLLQNFTAVAATGPQTIISNLVTELRTRIEKIFGELLLGGYSARHPGLEHKSGVPKGGTLVLAYTHKNLAAQILKQHKTKIDNAYHKVHSRYYPTTSEVMFRDPREVLLDAPGAKEPLDDFIVLADFCLPYLCCDTDCSDIGLEPVDRYELDPGVVSGIVYGKSADVARAAARLRAVEVRAVNLDTDTPVDVKIEKGEYAFSGPPGTYKIEVSGSRTFAPEVRIVTVGPGRSRTAEFILDRR